MKTIYLLLLISLSFSAGPEYQPFYKFAHQKRNVDSINVVGNYGEAAQDTFMIAPPVDQQWVVNRIIWEVEDNGVISADEFGAISGGLDSGIVIQVNRGTQLKYTLTNGLPIRSNVDWGAFCYDVNFQTFGAGNNYVQARWTVGATGQQILLDGGQSDSLFIIVNDTLTSLISQTFQIQGYNKGTRP